MGLSLNMIKMEIMVVNKESKNLPFELSVKTKQKKETI